MIPSIDSTHELTKTFSRLTVAGNQPKKTSGIHSSNTQIESKVEAETKAKGENPKNGVAPLKAINAKRTTTVRNAHLDDIHGVIRVSESHFITGGKDGYLKRWDIQKKTSENVFVPKKQSYTSWITALAVVGTTQWLSGTRDGFVDLWDTEGYELASFSQTVAPVVPSSHKSKERNHQRVLCLKGGLTPDIFYVGWPTQLTIHKIVNEEETKELRADPIGVCTTSSNDWVFNVTPLTERNLLVVTGAKLEIWQAKEGDFFSWKKTAALITEVRTPKTKKLERPFISDVVHLGQKNWYGLAIFGGTVKVMDVEAQKEVASYREHKDRVWTLASIKGANLFASCSDDHTIKLWDVRVNKSLATLTGNVGRVSTLLTLSENAFLSGSCPDDLQKTQERAQLTFWDIRKT